MRPYPCCPRGWQGGAGSPLECPVAEEDLLHEGQWSGSHTPGLTGHSQEASWAGMEGLGALGMLPVPLTTQLAQLGNQSLGSTVPRRGQPHKWKLHEQTSKEIADRRTDGKMLTIGESR